MEIPDLQRVRQMTCEDLERVLAWRNHIDVRRYMFTDNQISMAEHEKWFDLASQDSRRHLLIYERDGQPLGFVNIHEAAVGGVSSWGFYVAPHAPRGTGRDMGIKALDYAFFQLNFHKVCGQTLAFNERSIKFHLNLGFQHEGVLRDQHRKGGAYHNVWCFGLLADEWKSNYS